MKTNKLTTRVLKTCSLLAALVWADPVGATTLYWDTNGNGSGFGSATGTWGTGGSAWWTTDSSGGFTSGITDTTGSADVLNLNSGGAAPLTMTVFGSVSAQTLAALSSGQLVTLNNGGSGVIHLYGAGSGTSSAAIAQAAVGNLQLTINAPIVLEQTTGSDAYFYGGTGNSGTVTITGGITSTNSGVNLVLSGAGGMTISGTSPLNITGNLTGNILAAAAAVKNATISSNIGSNVTNVTQNGGVNSAGFCVSGLVLSGTNTYTGASTANSGLLQFGSLVAIGGSGKSVTANFGGAIGFASTVSQADINTALSTRVVATSTGAIAVNNNLAKNFDFATAGLSTASLGGYTSTTGAALVYTGTYTPYGSTYRLGGPSSRLALNNANLLTGSNGVIIYGLGNTSSGGTTTGTYVYLGGANNYTGETTINSGVLVLGASGTINNTSKISIAAGAALDVSAKASGYAWSTSTALSASGTGTAAATSAIIRGIAGQTIALGTQPITLNLASGLAAGDITHPALCVSAGNLSLGGNQFTVNAAAPLANGTYRLIQVGNGTTGVITDGGGYPTATGTALTGKSGLISVSSGNVILTVSSSGTLATKLVITSSPLTTTAGTATGTITVERQDGSSTPVTADPDITVTLASNSAGTVTFSPVSPLTIASGLSSATFTYTDTKAGSPTITASKSGLTNGTQVVTVTAAAASKLVFTTTPVTTDAGLASGNITVQQQDPYGNPNATDADRTLDLSSDSAGAVTFTPSSPMTIPTGQSSVTFTYTDAQGGTPTLTAASNWPNTITSAQQQETILAIMLAKKLVITSSPVTTTAGVASGTITVERQDNSNVPVTADSAISVALSSTSTGTVTFSPASPLTIGAGTSSATFTYTDTKAATPTITAASISLTSGTQQETVTATTANKLTMKTPPSTTVNTATVFSTQPTVYVQDTYGNVVTTDNTTVVTATVGTGTGPLTGNLTTTAVNGVATFSGLAAPTTAQTGLKLTFTADALASAVDTTSIAVNAPTPIESSWAGGSGNWSDSRWGLVDVGPYTSAWIAGSGATFGGTGALGTTGTVTVDGTYTVGVTGIGFDSGGFILNGGTLTRTNSLVNAVNTPGTVDTINSILGGSVGLQKGSKGTVILAGANTYTGATSFKNATSGVLNIQNNTALGATGTGNGTTVSSGNALELQGGITVGDEALSLAGTGISNGGTLRNISGTNTYGGLITLTAASRINSDSDTLTLDVASGNAITGTFGLTFGGAGNIAVADPIATSTGSLTKDGNGRLTLSGANTYTGATTVSVGTLALVGGSQQSAITVTSGASLGFTLGSPTTSTAAVTFSAGSKVTITGTPSGSYTLLTTTATITGTPTLDPAIPGFDLTVEGGNVLKLNATSAYAAWKGANAGNQDPDSDYDNDGVSNGVEYFMNITTPGFTASPTLDPGTKTITWTNGGNLPASAYGTQFVVQTSADLVHWADVDAANLTTNTDGPGGAISYTLTGTGPRFVRLKVTPN